MLTDDMDRAAMLLGAGALGSAVFAFVDPVQYRMVRLAGPGLAVLLVLALVAIAGARLGRRVLVAAAGAGFLAAGLLQLVQLGGRANWLRGDGSTLSLFLGFGVGLLALGLVRQPATAGQTTESTGRTRP